MSARRIVLAGLLAGIANSAFAQTVEYYHLDALGSVRAVSNQAGVVVERHDYLPFGEECTTGACAANASLPNSQPRQFTGKERDAETGMDYFGARYYSGKRGRFTAVDPVITFEENLVDPQRWNRYSYVRNNPLRYTDPDGRILFDFQEFKANVQLALKFGQDGYGFVVPTVAGIAALGSAASDALIATGGAINVIRAVGKEVVREGIKRATTSPKTGSAGGPGAGKRFSEATKEAERQANPNCVFCGVETTREAGPNRSNIDHAIPKSRGGNNSRENAQNTCESCNLSKHTLTTQEFLERRKSQ